MTETVQPPAVLQMPNENLKELMERAQAMHPNVVIGKTAEVDPHVVAVRDYAAFAMSEWEKQFRAANVIIQQQMGDAEIATVNGVPVVKRYQHPVKGFWTDPRDDDFLKGVKR